MAGGVAETGETTPDEAGKYQAAIYLQIGGSHNPLSSGLINLLEVTELRETLYVCQFIKGYNKGYRKTAR